MQSGFPHSWRLPALREGLTNRRSKLKCKKPNGFCKSTIRSCIVFLLLLLEYYFTTVLFVMKHCAYSVIWQVYKILYELFCLLSILGTCTNNTEDDCMLRNKTVVSDCEIMADDWVVNDTARRFCPSVPPISRPTSQPHCEAPPICELLQGR